MTFRRMGGQTITILRAPLEQSDTYDWERNWDDPDEYTVTGVSIQAGADPALKSQFMENTRGREETAVTYHCFQTPYTEPVRATDRVVWNGVTYEVFGEPNEWHNPRGHLEYRDWMMVKRDG